MRTLYLTVIPSNILLQNWNVSGLGGIDRITKVGGTLAESRVIVRCYKDGAVNWETTAIYNIDELVNKDVKFLKYKP